MSDENNTSEEPVSDEWSEAMAEQAGANAEAGSEPPADATDGEAASGEQYSPPAVQNLQDSAGVPGDESANLDSILDIPITLSMEIGRTKISIRNLLQLNQGSVVELDRLAGEPMDVMVNGTLVAHGEVVVVNEKFGIRLTDVVSTQERVKKLH